MKAHVIQSGSIRDLLPQSILKLDPPSGEYGYLIVTRDGEWYEAYWCRDPKEGIAGDKNGEPILAARGRAGMFTPEQVVGLAGYEVVL